MYLLPYLPSTYATTGAEQSPVPAVIISEILHTIIGTLKLSRSDYELLQYFKKHTVTYRKGTDNELGRK